MTFRSFFVSSGACAVAIVGALCAACSGSSDTTTSPNAGTVEAGAPETGGGAVVESSVVADLRAAGLDPANLPALEDLEAVDDAKHTKGVALMTAFAKSLGVDCGGCHEEKGSATGGAKTYDYEAETPEKAVARRMYDEWVRGFTRADGSPLFCDSCHQGKAQFLDRSDDARLAAWMDASFVRGLAPRAPGKKMACATCHGEPFEAEFLDRWEAKAGK